MGMGMGIGPELMLTVLVGSRADGSRCKLCRHGPARKGRASVDDEGHLRGQLCGVGDAPLDDLRDPVLGLAHVLDQVPDGSFWGCRHGGVRSGRGR